MKLRRKRQWTDDKWFIANKLIGNFINKYFFLFSEYRFLRLILIFHSFVCECGVAGARSLLFFLRGGKVKLYAVSIYLNMIMCIMGKFWLSMQRQFVSQLWKTCSEWKMCSSENNDWNESACILTWNYGFRWSCMWFCDFSIFFGQNCQSMPPKKKCTNYQAKDPSRPSLRA